LLFVLLILDEVTTKLRRKLSFVEKNHVLE